MGFWSMLRTLLACGFVLLSASAQADVSDADKARIDAAVKKGAAFLAKASWEYLDVAKPGQGANRDQYDVGVAALAGLALIESGVANSDPAVRRAVVIVRSNAPHLSRTYPICLAIMFLSRLNAAEDAAVIRTLSLRILAAQKPNGGWSYESPILSSSQEKEWLKYYAQREKATKLDEADAAVAVGPLPGQVGPDNSNTQFAILALWMARKYKVPVQYALLRTENRFRKTQLADGGWGYGMTQDQYSGAGMTCAGLLALAIGHGNTQERQAVFKSAENPAEPPKDDKAGAAPRNVEPGSLSIDQLNEDKQVLLARGFLETKLRGNTIEHFLYFLWSLERVCVVYGWDEKNWWDWYGWGSRILLDAQKPDGSWQDEYGKSVDTAFALLFLRRVNLLTEFKNAKFTSVAPGPQANLRVPEKAGSGDAPIAEKPKDDLPDDAKSLGSALVTSTGARREAILKKLSEGKNKDYAKTLASTIPQLPGTDRKAARDALAKRLEAAGVEELLQHLEGRDKELKLAAARAAASKKGKDPGKQLPGPLVALLDDFEDEIGNAAYESLKVLTGKDLGRASAAWKAWWRERSGP